MMDFLLDQMYQFYQENPMMVVSTIMLTVTYIYYTLHVVGKPVLHCRKGTVLHSMLDSLPVIHQEYRPTFWCWEPRLQSMVASFIRQTIPDIGYTREVFSFSDGGEVGLDWMRKVDGGAEQPILLILPGKAMGEYFGQMLQLNLAVLLKSNYSRKCVIIRSLAEKFEKDNSGIQHLFSTFT